MESAATHISTPLREEAPITYISREHEPNQKDLHKQYIEDGATGVFPIVDLEQLKPVHTIIFEKTKHLLAGVDLSRPLHELIALPFTVEPTKADFKGVTEAVESSSAFTDLIHSDAVRAAFRKIFNTKEVIAFPISRIRAQFPTLEKTTYNWHQDEGTWYAIKAKELAYKMPATLWLSINGADETNSIEIVPGTHRCKLQNHYLVEGQGFFNADLPPEFTNTERYVVKTKAGEGTAFHPLTFHRSVRGTSNKPRYSIDIRYYSEESAKEKYGVQLKFLIKRFFS